MNILFPVKLCLFTGDAIYFRGKYFNPLYLLEIFHMLN